MRVFVTTQVYTLFIAFKLLDKYQENIKKIYSDKIIYNMLKEEIRELFDQNCI